jgi:hypothetical protein
MKTHHIDLRIYLFFIFLMTTEIVVAGEGWYQINLESQTISGDGLGWKVGWNKNNGENKVAIEFF